MNKLWNKLKEKIYSCPCFQAGGCLCQQLDSTDMEKVRVPFFKICFGPFSLLLDNGKNFFLLALPYAAIVSLIAIAMGFGYMCLYSKTANINAYCSNSGLIYLVYCLLKLFLIVMFAIKWTHSGLLRLPLSFKEFISINCRLPKLYGTFLVVIFLNTLPLVSALTLYLRVPNPDWRIEVIFFAIVSIGFIIPFWAIRFYSSIAFVTCGCPIPPLKALWYKTSGSTMNLLASLFIIFVLAMFLIGNIYNNFQAVASNTIFYINFMSEFIYNIIFLMITALFINHCFVQKEILYPTEKKGEKK